MKGSDVDRWPARFVSRGINYSITLLDEGADVDTDPTLLLFREDEEEAVVTVHLTPHTTCNEDADGVSHVVVREGEE